MTSFEKRDEANSSFSKQDENLIVPGGGAFPFRELGQNSLPYLSVIKGSRIIFTPLEEDSEEGEADESANLVTRYTATMVTRFTAEQEKALRHVLTHDIFHIDGGCEYCAFTEPEIEEIEEGEGS